MNASGAFSGHACWSPRGSHETIFVDAASPSDAVFLATHQPMTLIRRPLRGDAEGEYVSEEALLKEFLKPDEKMMLLPIIGGSGTGKSHLVRWIRAQIGEADPHRRVVYVPKHGTSLRKVIELILEKMEGSEVSELREALADATSRLDERAAPSAVLSALADAVEFHDPRPTRDKDKDARRREVASLVPALLRDPFFRDEFFLAEGSLVRSFVERALRGHRPGDLEDAFEFTAKGLQDLTYLNSSDASRPARQAKAFLQTRPNADYAAELLTENLGSAIQSVFGLEGAVSLSDVMMETRRVLGERGDELVLLIEDFTMLQGIQRELLDAIVEPPERAGQAPLCGIRVTLAVTSGYWDTLADTVRTRAGFASHIYDLNVPLDVEGAATDSPVAQLISRYLNAARLGRDALDAAYRAVPTRGWIPNACDSCGFKNECHEAFGQVDGRGIYPFNHAAIKRTVAAVSDVDYMDPRAILGSVVKGTLEQHHDSIEAGRFPSDAYLRQFTTKSRRQRELPADVVFEAQRFPDPKRRVALLTIWGDCPTDLVDLNLGIHEAFKLPPIGVDAPEPRPRRPGPPVPHTPEPPSDPSPAQEDLDTVNAWVAGTAILDQRLARLVRRHLADAVWGSIDWDAQLMKRDRAARDRLIDQASFKIEEAAGGRDPGSGMWSTVLERSPENGALIGGIVQFEAAKNWAFNSGPTALRVRQAMLDAWAPSFLEHVRLDSGVSTPDAQASLIVSLAIDACVLGIPDSDSQDPFEVLAAALAPASTVDLQSLLRRTDGLAPFAREARDRRDAQIQQVTDNLGARQGGGGAHALDTTHLLPPIKDFTEQPSIYMPDSIVVAIREEMKRLDGVVTEVCEHIGDSRDSVAIARSVRAAAETAGEIRVFYPGSELSQFISLTRAAEDFDMGILEVALGKLPAVESSDPRAQLTWMSTEPVSSLNEYRAFLRLAHDQLSGALTRARQVSKSATEGLGADALAKALRDLSSSLQRSANA